MKKYIFFFCLLSSAFIFSQQNELAIQSYKDAEEAFNNAKYEITLSNLDITETILKTTNPKIQALRLKSYKHLALADSTKNFNTYASYVIELKTKKSNLANNAESELKNFSKEKSQFLETKRNNLIYPIEKILIGQSFSTIQRELYNLIDFEKPKEDNLFLYYNRKSNVSENQLGIYEIVINKESNLIVKITAVLKSLTTKELSDISTINNFYKEKFTNFDSTATSSINKIEKINKKEYNVATTQAKIDDHTLYFLNFYTPTKISFKDIKNENSQYFFTEGFEIK